jgi:hypothetical protein
VTRVRRPLLSIAYSIALVVACTPAENAASPAAPQLVSTPKPPAPVDTTTPSVGVYYANCDDVRDSGVDPLNRGDPGYRSGLDRDDDGLACE